MKDSPFNACDYLCEKCGETENCGVYAVLREKALSKQLSGKVRHEPGPLLEDVKESLDEAMEMLERIATEMNIDLTEVADTEDFDRHDVDRDELYQLSLTFTAKAHAFLKKIEPLITLDSEEAFEDVVWYHTLVSVKTHRAISSDYKGLTEDAVNSARVVLKSLVKCIHALEHIEGSHSAVSDECRSLSRTAATIKREIQRRFILKGKAEIE